MNCTEFLSKLTDYFDGQIEPDLLAEVKEHLGTCHHCEVIVNTTRKTIDIYRDQQTYEFPKTFADASTPPSLSDARPPKRAPKPRQAP